jgi:transcriptional regulator with XRE-family HTH domain
MYKFAQYARGCLVEIGTRLSEVRKITGFTQAIFAAKLGISPRAYTSYELGERDLPLAVAIELHQTYNVSADWLLFGEGNRETENSSENVEIAVIAALEYLEDQKLNVSPEKAAKMISHLFNYQRKSGAISLGYRDDYMRSAI